MGVPGSSRICNRGLAKVNAEEFGLSDPLVRWFLFSGFRPPLRRPNRYSDRPQSTLNSKKGFAQVNLSGDNEKYTCSCGAGRTNCRHLKGLASPAHGNRRALLRVSIWESRFRRIDGRSSFFGAKTNRSKTASFIHGSAPSAPAILRVNQEPN